MPTDPASGGTWFAVNDAGLVFALLNLYEAETDPVGGSVSRRSRGEIIPMLLDCADLEAVAGSMNTLEVNGFSPFRLVVTDGDVVHTYLGDESRHVRKQVDDLTRPWMATSSGLGDHLVQPPRAELFEQTFGETSGDWPAQQDRFHLHRWPEHLELSVLMSRPDASTVSVGVIEVDANQVSMQYRDCADGVFGESQTVKLARNGTWVA